MCGTTHSSAAYKYYYTSFLRRWKAMLCNSRSVRCILLAIYTHAHIRNQPVLCACNNEQQQQQTQSRNMPYEMYIHISFLCAGFFQFSCKACSAAAAASDKTSCCVRACACVLGTTTSQDVIFSITGGVYSGVSPSNTHDDSRYARLCSTRHCRCCYTKNNNQISAKWVWNANWF